MEYDNYCEISNNIEKEPVIEVTLGEICSDGYKESDSDISDVIPNLRSEVTVDGDIADLQDQIRAAQEILDEDVINNGADQNISVVSDSNDSDDSDGYVIEREDPQQVHGPPLLTTLIENYERDVEIEDDYHKGWYWTSTDDEGPSCYDFFDEAHTLLDTTVVKKPEHFFEAFFDRSMWTIIAEETNRYARDKIRKQRGGDSIDAIGREGAKKYSRLNNWKDINEGDVKVFMAHLIVTGLVKKPNLERYWCSSNLVATPFFGKYLSRNAFQKLLWNIHLANNSDALPSDHRNHDPLHKVRCFISMLERNFKYAYKPGRDISLDEASVAFKGRVKFKVRLLIYLFLKIFTYTK